MSTKVLIDSVHETMLKELAKKIRATQQDLVEDTSASIIISSLKRRGEMFLFR